MIENYIITLETEFKKQGNPENAFNQKKYLKNKFEFFGLTTPQRRAIQKPFLQKEYLPSKAQYKNIIIELWQKPEREFQHFALDLSYKYLKQIEADDIELFEYMILHKSWWDTVDGVAPKLVAEYFKKFPEQRDIYTTKWLNSGNIWLQRSTLIFQLFYKEDLDTIFLAKAINKLLGSKEFFINKAIGWILRQYSKTNPVWVEEFVDKTALSGLSKREALRLIQ
ncbi:DNA alkylation repair protein [Plebeiibacterium sediminum]|uniref:DNA alkylation repair protein n=1 Tax=Plebeiibacterium sediminum TaxID=2992112 RepID=A0AAE3SDH5_9BACT|nr:DNA alkylation repair protein [Plebeiobacterium sediminum]MCW3784862.1 DNA alkylation repair protein [Plebeiobacterium sediminum]